MTIPRDAVPAPDQSSPAASPSSAAFRFDAREIAGAFGDLGTLIPFVAAYIAIVKLDPGAVLLAIGAAYIVAGAVYRTPFPVQPMKAIGAVATTQSMHAAALSPASIHAAGLVTAAIWIVLGATGSRSGSPAGCRASWWSASSSGSGSASCSTASG
jgi:Molybdate transporter of MFS superfamily